MLIYSLTVGERGRTKGGKITVEGLEESGQMRVKDIDIYVWKYHKETQHFICQFSNEIKDFCWGILL